MFAGTKETTAPTRPVVAMILSIVAAVFTAYLVIGIAMPVLPLYVHQGMGFGTFVVGLVAGSQFTASLISRFWAGHHADVHGSKRAVTFGLVAAAVSGLFYLLSLSLAALPVASLVVLLIGRALLGCAESFIVAGGLIWGLGLAGASNTGTVMSWVGTAMYIAYAVGAPAGTALYGHFGFSSIATVTVVIPLVTLLFLRDLPAKPPLARTRPPFLQVVGAVSLPGMGLAFSSVGFGAITTFVALLFAERGWTHAWIALTAVSVAFILGRVAFGHLPDKIGGLKIAIVCILIEALGLGLIWIASSSMLVFLGAAIAGLGYSLVFPGFGVEAVRRAPPENRGLATGAYTAFLDLALGVANPALGLVAGKAGLSAVYLASALAVLCAAAVAVRLMAARAQ